MAFPVRVSDADQMLKYGSTGTKGTDGGRNCAVAGKVSAKNKTASSDTSEILMVALSIWEAGVCHIRTIAFNKLPSIPLGEK